MQSIALALLLALPVHGVHPRVGSPSAQNVEVAPLPVVTTLDRVTVYPDGARLMRRGERPAGAARILVQGLSPRLERTSLRVRATGAEVLGVEIVERLETEPTHPRIAELRAELDGLMRSIGELSAEDEQCRRLQTTWVNLLARPLEPEVLLAEEGRLQRLQELLPVARTELAELTAEQRAIQAKLAPLTAQRDRLHAELAGLGEARQRRVLDLVVDTLATAEGSGAIEIEYQVPGARWEPFYDLRVDRDMGELELVHRARLWQQSGEDWQNVEIQLSTARPSEVGVGPQVLPLWLEVGRPGTESKLRRDLGALGYVESTRAAAGPAAETVASPEDAFAEVRTEGLHLVYRVPRRETVLARAEPSEVLVGRASLSMKAERYAVPARDQRVWVLAKGQNSSPWTLLPGRAAVFVDGSYAGATELERTGAGASLELELGPDPSFTVERVQLADSHKEPGFFGSRASRTEGWRVRIAHEGGAGGAQRVKVLEALPRPRDQRIEVEVLSTKPKPDTTSDEAKKLQQELGVLTFEIDVPRGGEALLEWSTKVSWPADLEIRRRN
ncbi:MAG: mucoidy inhibitor MuiA family protein [Planctomycetaceae bacterium]|nr:mucoidy inhibitor MuiA family protein [Planctomycetaceae bacterium]